MATQVLGYPRKQLSTLDLAIRDVKKLIASGASVSDGDKGDIEVSGSGTVWRVEGWGGRAIVGTVTELVAAVATAGTGDVIYLRPGTYTLTSTLVISVDGLHLIGTKADTVIEMADFNTDIISIQASDVTIEGLNIRHGTVGHSNGAGGVGSGIGIVVEKQAAFDGDNITGPVIRDVEVTNTANWCIKDTGIYSYDDISYGDGFASAGLFSNTAEHPFPIWGYTTSLGTVQTITTTTNTATPRTLTSAALFANVRVGQYVYGTGIAHATRVTGKASNSSITISKDVTASGSVSLEYKHTTNCCITVEMVLDQVTTAYPNSGGALYIGYGGTTTKVTGLKTNSYSFGSFAHHFSTSPTSAITLGSVHVYGTFSTVFENKCIFQSTQAQSGAVDVAHDDVGATMLSFHVSIGLVFDAPYFEVLSTYLENGVNWYGGFPAAVDDFGYTQYWQICSQGSTVTITDPTFDCRTQKKDPADLATYGSYTEGYPARILRTGRESGLNLNWYGGRVNHHRRVYSAALGLPPVAPFENGDFYPCPENGTSTSAPWDRDDFLFQGDTDGSIVAPIHIEGLVVVNRVSGKVRDVAFPTAIGINQRTAFTPNNTRLLRIGSWPDSDQSGAPPSMDDVRVRTSFAQDFRPGMIAHVSGSGRFSVSDVETHTSTTIDSASGGFTNVVVGMKITDDFSRFPAGTYVTAKASNFQMTLNNAALDSSTHAASFWHIATEQREGLWAVSVHGSDWRQIPWIRKWTSAFPNIFPGDMWMRLNGTVAASVYPNAEFNWYTNGAWQSVVGLPRTTTATGDLIYYSATDTPARLPIGTTNHILKVTAGAPAWAAPEFLDTLFRVTDDGDPTKKLAFQTSGITTATTRTWTVPDKDLSFDAGTYTPTLTNVANLDASTAYQCQYIRLGAVVTVSGKVDVDPTTTVTATQLGISLPIASNIGAQEDCGGTAFASGIAGQGAAIRGDAANNRAEMAWVATDVTNQPMYFTFTYRII